MTGYEVRQDESYAKSVIKIPLATGESLTLCSGWIVCDTIPTLVSEKFLPKILVRYAQTHKEWDDAPVCSLLLETE